VKKTNKRQKAKKYTKSYFDSWFIK